MCNKIYKKYIIKYKTAKTNCKLGEKKYVLNFDFKKETFGLDCVYRGNLFRRNGTERQKVLYIVGRWHKTLVTGVQAMSCSRLNLQEIFNILWGLPGC